MAAEFKPMLERYAPARVHRPQMISAAARLCLFHWESQLILVERKVFTSAAALMRPQFEATVRAVWLLAGASDDWIKKFCAPGNETTDFPKIEKLLKRIKETEPHDIWERLDLFMRHSLGMMHSLVHGGVLALNSANGWHPEGAVLTQIRNANGLAIMAANLHLMAVGDVDVVRRIRSIGDSFEDVLPRGI